MRRSDISTPDRARCARNDRSAARSVETSLGSWVTLAHVPSSKDPGEPDATGPDGLQPHYASVLPST